MCPVGLGAALTPRWVGCCAYFCTPSKSQSVSIRIHPRGCDGCKNIAIYGVLWIPRNTDRYAFTARCKNSHARGPRFKSWCVHQKNPFNFQRFLLFQFRAGFATVANCGDFCGDSSQEPAVGGWSEGSAVRRRFPYSVAISQSRSPSFRTRSKSNSPSTVQALATSQIFD